MCVYRERERERERESTVSARVYKKLILWAGITNSFLYDIVDA